MRSWNTPGTLHEDNMSAISYFENGNITSRNKQFATKLEDIHRLTSEERIVTLTKISTKNQLADIMTKSLAHVAQSQHTDKMLVNMFTTHMNKIVKN